MCVLTYWLRLAATVFVLLLSVTSGQAVTCEEVRGLSATELAHWAERLQVSPTYLADLLHKAFCALDSKPDHLIAPDYQNRSMKSL